MLLWIDRARIWFLRATCFRWPSRTWTDWTWYPARITRRIDWSPESCNFLKELISSSMKLFCNQENLKRRVYLFLFLQLMHLQPFIYLVFPIIILTISIVNLFLVNFICFSLLVYKHCCFLGLAILLTNDNNKSNNNDNTSNVSVIQYTLARLQWLYICCRCSKHGCTRKCPWKAGVELQLQVPHSKLSDQHQSTCLIWRQIHFECEKFDNHYLRIMTSCYHCSSKCN